MGGTLKVLISLFVCVSRRMVVTVKFLLWALFSLVADITADEVWWVAGPTGGALVVIIALDVHDSRKKARARREVELLHRLRTKRT